MKTKTLLLVLTCLCLHGIARAQGTAFTYQGHLNDGAAPASGIYDLRFAIYDASGVSGNLVAGPLTNAAAAVSNGLFTVTLDFGADVFTGANRWLDIAVRTNGAATFAALTPRQPVTPAPYAITAGNVTGVVPLAQLPPSLVTNGAGSVTLNGAFSGNGANVTNVNAITLNGLTSAGFWKTNGNAGANPTNGAFLGTADNLPLEVRVNNQRAWRVEPTTNSPNIIGGYAGNIVSNGVYGAFIGGGGGWNGFFNEANYVSGNCASVMGGMGNLASGFASIAMGYRSTASSDYSTAIGGGTTASGNYSTAMGADTVALGDGSTALGWFTTARGSYSTAMGMQTTANGYASTAMGRGTVASGNYSTAMGSNTLASGAFSTASGFATTASGDYSTALGVYTSASGSSSTAMGYNSTAAGFTSTAMGGNSAANGGYSTAMGYNSTANGDYSLVSGNNSTDVFNGTNCSNAFVWGDGSRQSIAQGARTFNVLATGGFWIFSGVYPAGIKLAPGASAWTTLSDRNVKKNITPINYQSVLDKLAAVPVSQWNYNWEQDSDVPNLGPMAQDFKAAFYPGRDDKGITTLEFDGVELAAIQGLNQKLEQKETEITELKNANQSLEQRLEKLERLLEQKVSRE